MGSKRASVLSPKPCTLSSKDLRKGTGVSNPVVLRAKRTINP